LLISNSSNRGLYPDEKCFGRRGEISEAFLFIAKLVLLAILSDFIKNLLNKVTTSIFKVKRN